MTRTLLVQGNALSIPLADQSVHMVCCSPPYWGLRDYNVDGQIGLEQSPEEYVQTMVMVFREVWRVLRNDGTIWLNMGDSYAGSGQGWQKDNSSSIKRDWLGDWNYQRPPGYISSKQPNGLKPKDLVGIPWLIAFALRADGWWLRSEITWIKKAPMPESVQDRPTSATEKIFLLAKSPRYFYDAEAIREPGVEWSGKAGTFNRNNGKNMLVDIPGQDYASHREREDRVPSGRNMRNYLFLGPEPYSGSHFAVFPTALVEPCIKAGSSEYGVCGQCGAPWERVVELTGMRATHGVNNVADFPQGKHGKSSVFASGLVPVKDTTGWQPTCVCGLDTTIPATVLDPFVGSGTTLQVARALGRHGVGCDLSLPYLRLARERLELNALEAWTNGKRGETVLDDLPLFTEQP